MLQPTLRTIVICNTCEFYQDFLLNKDLPNEAYLIHRAHVSSDRSLLWLGDHKLVVTSLPVPHLDYLQTHLGYAHTKHIYPANPSPSLCSDILADPTLIEQIKQYAQGQPIQIIPFGITRQFYELISYLSLQERLVISLPESPDPRNLWIKSYLDTKAGFTHYANRWITGIVRMPLNTICYSHADAVAAAQWYLQNNMPCLIKPNRGYLAMGQFSPKIDQDILSAIESEPYLRNEILIVEEKINSTPDSLPSLEFIVPPIDQGLPSLTYVCNQLFTSSGLFAGVFLDRQLETTSWYTPMVSAGLELATQLQKLGYVGHFDLDGIVDTNDQAYVLEINPRRTGGTHVHEIGGFLFGQDYLDHCTLLSDGSTSSGKIAKIDDLLNALSDLLWPIQQEQRGVIITHSSDLADHHFGYIIVAPNQKDALQIVERMFEKINAWG